MGGEVEQQKGAVADALAALGLVLEDGDAAAREREWHLWPECLDAFELFLALQTQWVVGMAGPVGLSYPSVESLLRLRGLKARERRERFAEIQCLERGWIQGWRQKREAAQT